MNSELPTAYTYFSNIKINKTRTAKNSLLFLCIITTGFLTGCTALLQTQTSVQKATGQLPPRAYVITYPPNKNRIKPTLIPGGKMLTTNPNPWGTRYKDYIYKDYDIISETYKKSAPTYNGGNMDLIMDIFSPRDDAEKKRPCVVYIFGGGFYMKVDDCTTEVCTGMVQKGYVVASMDYRIGFQNAIESSQCQGDFNTGFYPAVIRAIQDARSAVRYLKANAERLGIDPNKIFIGGQSAGAITALGMALYDESDIPKGILDQVGGTLDPMKDNMQYNTHVAGVFTLAGAILTEKIMNKKANADAVELISGSCDELIDPVKGPAYKCKQKNTFPEIAGSGLIYEFMKNNNTVKFDYMCGGGHGMSSVGFNKLLTLISDFTYSVVQGNPIKGKEIMNADAPVCNNAAGCK
ncbi:MAG: esterase/lipase-like protein [Bacteroidota bacterium]|nr:esterase/lipase-like protein [Bacteroidota bacterium]